MKGKEPYQCSSFQALAPSSRRINLKHGLLCPWAYVNPQKLSKSQVGVTAFGMLSAPSANWAYGSGIVDSEAQLQTDGCKCCINQRAWIITQFLGTL